MSGKSSGQHQLALLRRTVKLKLPQQAGSHGKCTYRRDPRRGSVCLLCSACRYHRTDRSHQSCKCAEPQRRCPYQYSLRRPCSGRLYRKQDSVWAISSLLSAKQPEVADAVVRVKEDARQQKERANALQAELLKVQMNALPSPEETCHVLLFVGELDAIALRNAVNSLTEKYSGYCGIFAGDDTNGYRFIVGSASCNCQELADRMRRELSAKGGGSAPMIQGNVAVTADTLQTMWVSL